MDTRKAFMFALIALFFSMIAIGISDSAITQLEIIDLMQPYLNGKVNKSGDTMTGSIRVNMPVGVGSDTAYSVYKGDTLATYIRSGGYQDWYLNYSNVSYGHIGYGSPGGNPGIALWNSLGVNRSDIWLNAETGICIGKFDATNFTGSLCTGNDKSVTIPKLAGTGNRPLCADSTGKIVIC